MFSINRFFYNADGSEGGNSGGEANVLDGQQAQVAATAEQPPISLPEDVVLKLKEYEELKAWRELQNAPQKSAEEIAKENEQDKAEFLKYSVDNDLLKLDEYTKYESLKVQSDADLVFPSFFEDFKEENPDIEDANELAEAAKEAFDKTYKLSSDNEKLKNKGLAKLAKEANEIRTPFESKIKSAESSYKEEKEIKSKIPSFDKFFQAQLEKNTPDKIQYKVKVGEDEIPVEIELTKEDKESIAKEFNTPKTFYKFNKSPEEAEKALDKKIQGWIKSNKFEEATSKAIAIGEGRGIAKGSNTGADAPFAMKQQSASSAAKVFTLQQSNEKIAEARARFN